MKCSWREVDQGRKGSCLEQLSGDTGRFPNMSRMGQDPRSSGQGLVLIDSCPDVGRYDLGMSTRQRATAQTGSSTAKLVPSLLPTSTLL